MIEQRLSTMDRRIKFRHLRCFIEVARLKSVVKAASVLHISQPAISKTVQELEELLGVVLFEPNRRTMLLTGAGEIFLRYASASVTALKQGVRMVGGDEMSPEHAFTVGALPTAAARILPATLAHVTERYERLRPRVVTGANDVLMAQLRLGDLDLVIGRMAAPETMTGFNFEHLYSERIALVVRPEHPLLRMDTFVPAAIAQYQLLMPPPGSVISSTVERYMIANSIQPGAGVIETVSDSFARGYLLQTDAIWFISEGVVTEDAARGLLALLPAYTEDTLGPVGLTTRADAVLSLSAQIFIAALREITAGWRASELPGGPRRGVNATDFNSTF